MHPAPSVPARTALAGVPDPFRVLDLPYTASPDDVRRAFRRRARQTHPDRGGSTQAFHEVRAAYGALAADLEGARRQWPAPAPTPAPRAPRGPVRLDPRVYPTCPVRIDRTRDGRRTVAYDAEARPRGWRPGPDPPPGGTCQARYPESGGAPAFGVWTVPLDARRFRCVFGP